MTTSYGTILDRASKMKKLLAIGATVLIASVTLASPAWADVGTGRLLEVDYTSDFVLLEGYPDGEVTVEVLRGTTTIGTFTGPVVGGILEINHGGNDPVTGVNDCWQGDTTPNISPGDQVRVTGAGIDDSTFVRNLDYEDVNGRLMGVATGNEVGGAFVNTPISLGNDPEVDGAAIDMRRIGPDARGTMDPGAISQTSGAFDVALAGTGGEVTLQYLNPTDGGGEESTVAGPVNGPAPEALEGCPDLGPADTLVDGLAPDVPSVPDLDAASDTGSSNTDNLTTDTTPTFTGSAESRSTVEILVGGNVVGSGQTIGGKYNITTANALGVGTHSVTARATDAAGNVSVQSAALSVTIQRPPAPKPPAPPAINAKPMISQFGPTRSTRDRTPLVRATVTDRDSAISKGNIRLFVDNKRIAAGKIRLAKVNAGTRVSFQSRALRPGSLHKVRMVVNDKEGGITSKSWRFRVR